MPGVIRGETLPKKHVTQMAAAVRTLDFCTRPIWVGQVFDGSRLLLIERRPSAMGLKFVFRLVKFGIATAAQKYTWLEEVIVLSGERRFSALILNHVSLCR